MSLVPKQHIAILSVSAALSAFSLASIVNFTDPYTGGWPVFLFFYLSLFILSFSLLTLLGFFLKRWLWAKILLADLTRSARQGALIAAFLTLTVALQASGILYWWLELSLILFFVAVEIFINLKQ